jgi:transcriptional regulator with XRE-family HTH domain
MINRINRVKRVIKWLILTDFASSESDLAEKLGYKKSSLSQILNEKVPLSEKFIQTLCDADKNINKVWIETGEGAMVVLSDLDTYGIRIVDKSDWYNTRLNEIRYAGGMSEPATTYQNKKEQDLNEVIELQRFKITKLEEELEKYKSK